MKSIIALFMFMCAFALNTPLLAAMLEVEQNSEEISFEINKMADVQSQVDSMYFIDAGKCYERSRIRYFGDFLNKTRENVFLEKNIYYKKLVLPSKHYVKTIHLFSLRSNKTDKKELIRKVSRLARDSISY